MEAGPEDYAEDTSLLEQWEQEIRAEEAQEQKRIDIYNAVKPEPIFIETQWLL